MNPMYKGCLSAAKHAWYARPTALGFMRTLGNWDVGFLKRIVVTFTGDRLFSRPSCFAALPKGSPALIAT